MFCFTDGESEATEQLNNLPKVISAVPGFQKGQNEALKHCTALVYSSVFLNSTVNSRELRLLLDSSLFLGLNLEPA